MHLIHYTHLPPILTTLSELLPFSFPSEKKKLSHRCRSENFRPNIFLKEFPYFHLAQELPVMVPARLSAGGISSFSHYIICFYFLSSVTARQPIRIIKTTFKQFAAEFLIFLAWSLFPMHRCGMSRRERGPDSITLLLFIWAKIWV